MAMTYGNVYVASVAMGAKNEHTLRAFMEAESYDGPSLIIAYSHCIAHGINMAKGMQPTAGGGGIGSLAALPLRPPPPGAGREPADA
jgi:pyruvate-ferredoxin/flavodoxin oxidoreductase